MPDNQRRVLNSTGNASQPTGTAQSNGQQSSAPNDQVIQATSEGGQVVIVKYRTDQNWATLSIAGSQVLCVQFNQNGGNTMHMGGGGGRQGFFMNMFMSNSAMAFNIGGHTINVQTIHSGLNVNIGGGQVIHVQYNRNGITATLSRNGVLVRPTTTENPPVAVGGGPTVAPLLGFSDADIDRVSTTFSYVEPPEGSSKGEDPCSICLEPFKAKECMRKLRCGHEFHSDCVVPWLRRQTTCPNCRRKITLKR